MNGHGNAINEEYQQYEDQAPPHYEPLTPNQQARLPALAPSKPNSQFSSPPSKRTKTNSGRSPTGLQIDNTSEPYYAHSNRDLSGESQQLSQLAPLVNGKVADGHMCDICGKAFKRIKDKKAHMKCHKQTQDLRKVLFVYLIKHMFYH